MPREVRQDNIVDGLIRFVAAIATPDDRDVVVYAEHLHQDGPEVIRGMSGLRMSLRSCMSFGTI